MSAPSETALHNISGWRLHGDHVEAFDDVVIDESAIALSYNGSAHAVMMATARDLEDFALGFSLSEGIVATAAELQLIEISHHASGCSIELLIPQARFDALQQRPRARIGNSACGLCGIESLQAAMRAPSVLTTDDGETFSGDAIHQALRALNSAQQLNRRSGGVHAAGFAGGDQLLVREDVGRHSALDKLIGARARSGLTSGFVVMSSRASYELVHKSASAGIKLLATVSAPTSAAITLAQRCGLTLIAFARNERMNIYTHARRISGLDAAVNT